MDIKETFGVKNTNLGTHDALVAIEIGHVAVT